MNLQVLKKSRKKPVAGDIFVFKIDDHFRFGLVVSTEATAGFGENFILVYLYDYISSSPLLDHELSTDHLLIPPIVSAYPLWTHGYFQTIDSRRIEQQEILRQHCFGEPDEDKYYDEFGNRLKEKSEPCGLPGLVTERGIDEELSKALGLRIPTDEDYMGIVREDDTDEDSDEPHFVEIMFNPEDLQESGIEDLMTIEDALDDAFAKAGGFASWSGNGISADFVHIDLEVKRDSLDKALKLIGKVLKKLRASVSTYVNVNGKRKELNLS